MVVEKLSFHYPMEVNEWFERKLKKSLSLCYKPKKLTPMCYGDFLLLAIRRFKRCFIHPIFENLFSPAGKDGFCAPFSR